MTTTKNPPPGAFQLISAAGAVGAKGAVGATNRAEEAGGADEVSWAEEAGWPEEAETAGGAGEAGGGRHCSIGLVQGRLALLLGGAVVAGAAAYRALTHRPPAPVLSDDVERGEHA